MESSSNTIALSNCSKHLSFNLDLPLDDIGAFVISLVFSALNSILYFQQLCRTVEEDFWFLFFLSKNINDISIPQINSSDAYDDLSVIICQSIRHNPFEKNVKRVGHRKHSYLTPF